MNFKIVFVTLLILALIVSPAVARCTSSIGRGTPSVRVVNPTPTPAQQCGETGTVNTIFPFNPSGCAEMPRIPMTFGGCVFIDGVPAPAGTTVCVRGDNVLENCLILGPGGCFGQGTFDPKLVAQGTPVVGGMINIQEGTDLTFWVNGEKARVCIDGSCRWSTQFHTGHHKTVTLYLVTCK